MKKIRLAYANTYFQKEHAGGGHVHMEQFVSHATALGHEIWSWPNNEYPSAQTIPSSFFNFLKTMRQMDVLYVRLERNPPNICRWSLPPYRSIYGFPVVVWEFNTIPEEGLLRGQTEKDIQPTIEFLRYYGRGCDLAICVSDASAKYVKEKIGIQRVLVVPNGSDPELFHPGAQPVKRMMPFRDQFNVVWIGSAGIEYHDFETLRRAAWILWDHKEQKKINFHIIGTGLKGEMGDMPANVYYWGAEFYRSLPQWLSSMNVGVYISHGGSSGFGTPLKVFDYMSSGLAVIGTEHPFLRDLFQQLGQLDLLVPIRDPERLAGAILKLSVDSDRTKILGQVGRKLVVDQYNWQRAVIDTFQELENILENRQCACSSNISSNSL